MTIGINNVVSSEISLMSKLGAKMTTAAETG